MHVRDLHNKGMPAYAHLNTHTHTSLTACGWCCSSSPRRGSVRSYLNAARCVYSFVRSLNLYRKFRPKHFHAMIVVYIYTLLKLTYLITQIIYVYVCVCVCVYVFIHGCMYVYVWYVYTYIYMTHSLNAARCDCTCACGLNLHAQITAWSFPSVISTLT